LKKKRLEWSMQQPQVMTYAAIAEVRAVTGAAACNQLLADGWVLLGVYPITTVAEMTPREADGSSGNRISSAMSGGSWGMWWERNENRNARKLLLCLPFLTNTMITDTAYGW
jgi:hypothetical protein